MQEENQTHLFEDISFDQTARQHLRNIIKWSMIIVVVSVTGYVISLVQVFFSRPDTMPSAEGFVRELALTGEDTFSTILSVIVGLAVNFFLYRFASNAKAALDGMDQNKLGKSFGNLKSYFIIMAVLFIIAFAAIILVVSVFAVNPG